MNGTLRLRANAKVNLSLDVTGVREDGYHNVDMVNRSVTLFDEIEFAMTPGQPFSIVSNVRYFPTDEKNLIWKAAKKLCECAEVPLPDARCAVRKRIPSQAGLGGGSADAAASLVAFNILLGLGFGDDELSRIGATVGADVPFCLSGGTARVTGIGELIEPAEDIFPGPMLIAMPRYGRSTKEAYAMLDKAGELAHPDTGKVLEGLAAGDPEEAYRFAGNVFEAVTADEVTAQLKDKMRADGAVYSAMTGTGAAVFGIFQRAREAMEARDLLRTEGYSAWVVYRAEKGVEITE